MEELEDARRRGRARGARIGALVRREQPRLVVGTGGYAAGVALAYAVVHRIPIVQQAGDSHPGLTARAFRRWTRETYLAFPEAARVLGGDPAQLIDTGAPIEPPPSPRPDRAAARATWGFPPTGGRVLLIYGGSQGSLAMNRVVAEWVRRGLPDDLYLIWMTGGRASPSSRRSTAGACGCASISRRSPTPTPPPTSRSRAPAR